MSLNIKYFMCLFLCVISGNFALKLQNSSQEQKSICFLYLKKKKWLTFNDISFLLAYVQNLSLQEIKDDFESF